MNSKTRSCPRFRRLPGLPAVVASIVVIACGRAVEVPQADLVDAEPEIVQAVEQARADVARDPHSAKTWAALGDWYYTLEWYDEAAACYVAAEGIEPKEFLWPYAVGHSLSGKADLVGAAAAFERAVALNERYAAAHVILADVLVQLGRTEEARRHYLLAGRLDPTLSHASLGAGQVELSAGRYDEALSYLNEALRRDPRHAEVHQALAQVYLALGDGEMARYHAEVTRTLPKATRLPDPLSTRILQPAGSLAMVEMGASLMREGRLDEAEERLREAVRADPRHRGAWVRLGELLTRQGRFAEATQALQEAVRMNAADIYSRELLAEALEGQGLRQEAASQLRIVLDIDPGRPGAARRLQELESGP